MSDKEIQYHKSIVQTLCASGVFAISEIVHTGELSRESVGNILQKLVSDGILKKTAQRGAGVRYELARTENALVYVYGYTDEVTIEQFAKMWDVSIGTAKNSIKKFVDNSVLEKIGTPPRKIIYILKKSLEYFDYAESQKEFIQKNYAHTTPDGRFMKGMEGFDYWARHRSGRKDYKALAKEYIETRKKFYNGAENISMIDATNKLEHVFGQDVFIEKLFHRDYDAIAVFGKTYLSQLVRIAKSGQTNKVVMGEIVQLINGSVQEIIRKYDIDCVGYIPPTVARKTQLMTFIARNLNVPCKNIDISKVKSHVPVQQKSLKKVEDRTLNAQKTIAVSSDMKCDNVLLIDDVTGSGATLNETARKIINQGIAKKVYAFTVTGSAKAGVFEVISEA